MKQISDRDHMAAFNDEPNHNHKGSYKWNRHDKC